VTELAEPRKSVITDKSETKLCVSRVDAKTTRETLKGRVTTLLPVSPG